MATRRSTRHNRRHRIRGLGIGRKQFETLEDRLLLATTTLLASKDNSLFEDSAGALSSGAGEFLYAGQTISAGSRRALIAFDASEIPTGSTITEATLRLTVSKAARNTTDTAPFALHRLTSDWGEGTSDAGNPGGRGAPATTGDATWLHTLFSSDTWSTPGGDFVSTASATADVGGDGTMAAWSSAGMAADVQAWVSDPSSNFGWIIIGDETINPTGRRFNSRDNFGSLLVRPSLEVVYEPAAADSLTLTLTDVSISENGGTTTATVSRTTTAGDLTVNLSSSDEGEASVPSTVVIPDGQMSSPPFAITAVDDALLDGTQTVTVTASAAGIADSTVSLEVTDHEQLTVTLADAAISENGASTTGTVTRTDATGELTVSLASSDTSEATVPASVTILDGAATATFTVSSVDDTVVDGDQAVTVTATAAGYQSGAATVDVIDDELSVVLTPSKDNTLFESQTGDLSSGGGALFAGQNGNGEPRRGLVAFDLAGSAIPAGSTVLSAQLEMFVSRSSSEVNSEIVALHRVTQDWGEGASGAGGNGGGGGAVAQAGDATWVHTFFDTAFWTNPGGDFVAAPSAATNVGLVDTTAVWSTAELTADVQGWLNDASNNFGWIIIGNESAGSTTKRFDSKESTSGSPPRLIVSYQPPSEQLTLSVEPTSISENGGTAVATVTRSGDTTGDLTVFLSSSDETEVTVPASVTIPDAAASVTFTVTAVDDQVLDGTQAITVTASAQTFQPAAEVVAVTDDEAGIPTTAVIEGGILKVTGSAPNDAWTIRVDGTNLLLSDPTNRIAFGPAPGAGAHEVTIPLADFPNGVELEMGGGSNSLTLDPTINDAVAGLLSLAGGESDDALFVQGADISLDLSQLTAVEQVDISGAGANSLTLDVNSVLQNVDSTTSRFAVMSNLEDTVNIGDGWALTGTELGEAFFRLLVQDGATLLLNGPADWQNPVTPNDVNNDGVVSPVGDVLPMINETNAPQIVDSASRFPQPNGDVQPTPFADVNGDGTLSPVGDILPVINFLNSQGDPEGEGTQGARADGGLFWLPQPAARDLLDADNRSANTPPAAVGVVLLEVPPVEIEEGRQPAPTTPGHFEELLETLAGAGPQELLDDQLWSDVDWLTFP